MSDTPTKYKWVLSSTACSSCQSMATEEYTEKPARPHARCQCTIVAITSNAHEGSTDTLPTIISVERAGGHTEYHEGSNKPLNEIQQDGRENFSGRGEYYFDVTVRCPKNNEIVLHVVVELEDGELFDVLSNWGSVSAKNEDGQYPPPKDDFEKEIVDAIEDYSGGLEFKALEIARSILASEGRDLCKQ